MKTRTLALSLGLLFSLIGCATQPQITNWDTSPTARIIRVNIGEGGSPTIYDAKYYIPNLQIWGDGRVIWVSRNNTQRRVLEGQLTTDQVRTLLQRIGDAGFFTWKNRYSRPLGGSIDYAHLSVAVVGQTKEVIAANGGPFPKDDGFAPDKFYELTNYLLKDFIHTVGVVGHDYVPDRGYLTAQCFPKATIVPDWKWPDAKANFTLDQVGTGRYIEGETLAFAWQLMNKYPGDLIYIESNKQLCIFMVQIPGVSYYEPPQ